MLRTVSNSLKRMVQSVHLRRHWRRTDNRPGGHSPVTSPFPPVHPHTSSARSESIEKKFEGASTDGWRLSDTLPPRPVADGDPSKRQISEAWRKLEGYSQLDILSQAAGTAGVATTVLGGSAVVISMFALLRVVVRRHLAQLIVRADKLLSSFRTVLDIIEPSIVGESQIILDGLAEAMQFLRAFATDTVRSKLEIAEKAVVEAEAQFNRILLLCIVLHVTKIPLHTTEQ
ncbi:hypothetical protein DFS33DRAFT_1422705 [Desarmillaria ectypa]|nr:hypothetical protein DFS33DRAFT_1422705 [Desarmillaria ectypa]